MSYSFWRSPTLAPGGRLPSAPLATPLVTPWNTEDEKKDSPLAFDDRVSNFIWGQVTSPSHNLIYLPTVYSWCTHYSWVC